MYSFPLDNNNSSLNPKREASLRALRMQSGYENSYISPEAMAQHNDPFSDPIQGNRIIISSRLRNTDDDNTSSFTIPFSTTLTNTSAIRIMNVDIPVTGSTINEGNDSLYFSEEVGGGSMLFNLFAARLPHGIYTATDLATVIAFAMQCAQCQTSPIVSPANTYTCVYEDTFSNTIRISSTVPSGSSNMTPFAIQAPTLPQGTIMNHMNRLQITSIAWNSTTHMLTFTTKNKTHGIAQGDVIATLIIRPQFLDTVNNNQRYAAPTLTLQNHAITKSDVCDPNSNVISIAMDASLWTVFANANVSFLPNNVFTISESSYLSTMAMERNVGKTLGFTRSVSQSHFDIIGVGYNTSNSVATFITSSPHGFSIGGKVTVYVQGKTLANQTITVIPNDQTFCIHYVSLTSSPNNISPAGDISGAQVILTDGTNGTISVMAISPQKVDLTLQSRVVLVHLQINRTQEVGNVFVPNVNHRFMARVQLNTEPGTIQFNHNSEHIIGTFQLDSPIQKINGITISLYNETGLLLYDTHGVEWSAVLEFMCDNNGNQ